MIVIPAIDLLKGKAVRLFQGDFQKKQIVSDDPVAQALIFQENGIKILHVVDLDGAKVGQPRNMDVIKRIINNLDILVEVGGGIRTEADIENHLNIGARRIILGSKAVYDFDFVKKVCQKYGDKIIIGVDSKDGFVMTNGWLNTSMLKTIDFIKQLEKLGVRRVIFTDISRDGTLTEPNYVLLKEIMSVVRIPIIASGGVRDLTQLNILDNIGVEGVIVGKALYSGTLDLKQAVGSF